MLADQQILRIPGPTPIPPSVQRAMSQPMIGHRDEETSALLRVIGADLKSVFGTEQEVAIIAASGTAGLEAAIVNAVHPGEEVLVLVTGAFGQRFVKICEAYDIHVHVINYEWGKAIVPSEVQAYLQKNNAIKAVFSTFCETSTGILNPIKELSSAIAQVSEALVIVDGVSCVGGVETKMDEWGIDIIVTGSQKALMVPAGLALIATSKRAWKHIETNKRSRYYLDLTTYRDNLLKLTTPYTPAISLLYGLKQSLQLLKEEGLQQVYDRHDLLMRMTRAAIKALDIPLLTNDDYASPTITAIQPDDFDAVEFRKLLKNEFGLSVAGGQGHLSDKIFRIGHMGYCSPADVLQTIAVVELGLMKIGETIELGIGTAAAQRIYLSQGVR